MVTIEPLISAVTVAFNVKSDTADRIRRIARDYPYWSDDKILRELLDCAEGEGRV